MAGDLPARELASRTIDGEVYVKQADVVAALRERAEECISDGAAKVEANKYDPDEVQLGVAWQMIGAELRARADELAFAEIEHHNQPGFEIPIRRRSEDLLLIPSWGEPVKRVEPMQVVDVRTRSYPAKAVMWDGSWEQAALICEWIQALGECQAAYDNGDDTTGVPPSIRLTFPSGGIERAAAGDWIVQDANDWHEVLTPEQYGNRYDTVRVFESVADADADALAQVEPVEIQGVPTEFERPSIEDLAARLDTGDDEVKGVVDLDLKHAESLTAAIFTAVGAASMSWPHVSGVFNDAYARDIAAQLEHEVYRRTKPRVNAVAMESILSSYTVSNGVHEHVLGDDDAGMIVSALEDAGVIETGLTGEVLMVPDAAAVITAAYPASAEPVPVPSEPGSRIRAKVIRWGAAKSWPGDTSNVTMQLAQDKTWYADGEDPTAPFAVTQLSYDHITVLEILRNGYDARCPNCNVERTDLENGPRGLVEGTYLSDCPNCGSTKAPVIEV